MNINHARSLRIAEELARENGLGLTEYLGALLRGLATIAAKLKGTP